MKVLNFASPMIGLIKSGRDKIPARGLQIGPNLHQTDEKLKD
jgi:hypothetical protein